MNTKKSPQICRVSQQTRDPEDQWYRFPSEPSGSVSEGRFWDHIPFEGLFDTQKVFQFRLEGERILLSSGQVCPSVLFRPSENWL